MKTLVALMLLLGNTSIAETTQAKKITSLDHGILEEWESVTEERDLWGIGVSKISETGYTWRIFVSVAEFIRKEPLQSKLFSEITKVLLEVPEVSIAVQEDREVWLIQGNPTGEDLIKYCSKALNGLHDELRKEYDSL